jgi:hypothetical protein
MSTMHSKRTTVCMTNFPQKRIRENTQASSTSSSCNQLHLIFIAFIKNVSCPVYETCLAIE